MNKEYISREELRKHLKECYDDELFDADMKKAVIGIDIYVENMPSADVQPVKHGRWSLSGGYVTTAYGTIRYQICSVCGANLLENDIDYNYCPICGARMDLKENNDA